MSKSIVEVVDSLSDRAVKCLKALKKGHLEAGEVAKIIGGPVDSSEQMDTATVIKDLVQTKLRELDGLALDDGNMSGMDLSTKDLSDWIDAFETLENALNRIDHPHFVPIVQRMEGVVRERLGLLQTSKAVRSQYHVLMESLHRDADEAALALLLEMGAEGIGDNLSSEARNALEVAKRHEIEIRTLAEELLCYPDEILPEPEQAIKAQILALQLILNHS